MIKFKNEVFSQNQAAKVLLKSAIEVAKEHMSEEFKEHVGLDLESMTVREKKELDKSIQKWCTRLEKSLNINFDYNFAAEVQEEEEEMVYYQLKSGGFAAKGYYVEDES